MSLVEDMEPEEAMAFIHFLEDKDSDDKMFQRWCAGPQFKMSFQEFKNRVAPVPVVPDDVILKDVFEIIRDMSGGEPNGDI